MAAPKFSEFFDLLEPESIVIILFDIYQQKNTFGLSEGLDILLDKINDYIMRTFGDDERAIAQKVVLGQLKSHEDILAEFVIVNKDDSIKKYRQEDLDIIKRELERLEEEKKRREVEEEEKHKAVTEILEKQWKKMEERYHKKDFDLDDDIWKLK